MPEIIPQDYKTLLTEIKERIRTAQYTALKAVNTELISLYWDIGKNIVEKQKGETWGKSVVERLSEDLRKEFPEMTGFSGSNLWRMKIFYESYAENEKLAPMVREIGWSHNIFIFEKCKDDLEREFYVRMTRKFGWTKRLLQHHIENQNYEKTLLSRRRKPDHRHNPLQRQKQNNRRIRPQPINFTRRNCRIQTRFDLARKFTKTITHN